MKANLLTLLLISLVCIVATGQTNDTIKVNSNNTFTIDGKILYPKHMKKMMNYHPDAYRSLNKASFYFSTARACLFLGGWSVVHPVGQWMKGDEPNWMFVGVGAVLIGGSIPLAKIYHKHAEKAVYKYNRQIKNQEISPYQKRISLGITSNGLGITYTF